MIRCAHCSTDNMDGSEYCDECGARLSGAGARAPAYAPPQPPPPPVFARENVNPRPAIPYMAPPPPPPVRRSGQLAQSTARRSGGNPPVNRPQTSPLSSGEHLANQEPENSGRVELNSKAKLIIQRGGKVGKEFPVSEPEALIGRWDADGGIFPDIDLDQDDPEAKVSRRHARIQSLNNQFMIEDLGSTNGTFINRGPRLLPGNKQPLKHGDEIIVGKTFLKFVLS